MSVIYNSYMTESERLDLINESKEDIVFDKLIAMYESVINERDINLKMAELKVIEESGTNEDLEQLYEDAEKEANQQSAGIISSIFTAIKTIWQGIKNTIKKFFSNFKSDGDPEVTVGDKDEEAVGKLDTIKANFKKIINCIKTKQFLGIAAVAAITTILVIFKKGKDDGGTKTVKLSVLKNWIHKADSTADEIASTCDTAGEVDASDSNASKGMSCLKAVSTAIRTFVSYLMGKATQAGHFIADKAGDLKDKVTGKSKIDKEKQEKLDAMKSEKKKVADDAEKAEKNKIHDARANEARKTMSDQASEETKQGGLHQRVNAAFKKVTADTASGRAIKYKNGDLSYVDSKGIKYRNKKNSQGALEWQKKNDKDGKWYVMGSNVTPPGFSKDDVLTHESEESPWVEGDEIVVENTDDSIFGYSLKTEEMLQENEIFEATIDELISLFDEADE